MDFAILETLRDMPAEKAYALYWQYRYGVLYGSQPSEMSEAILKLPVPLNVLLHICARPDMPTKTLAHVLSCEDKILGVQPGQMLDDIVRVIPFGNLVNVLKEMPRESFYAMYSSLIDPGVCYAVAIEAAGHGDYVFERAFNMMDTGSDEMKHALAGIATEARVNTYVVGTCVGISLVELVGRGLSVWYKSFWPIICFERASTISDDERWALADKIVVIVVEGVTEDVVRLMISCEKILRIECLSLLTTDHLKEHGKMIARLFMEYGVELDTFLDQFTEPTSLRVFLDALDELDAFPYPLEFKISEDMSLLNFVSEFDGERIKKRCLQEKKNRLSAQKRAAIANKRKQDETKFVIEGLEHELVVNMPLRTFKAEFCMENNELVIYDGEGMCIFIPLDNPSMTFGTLNLHDEVLRSRVKKGNVDNVDDSVMRSKYGSRDMFRVSQTKERIKITCPQIKGAFKLVVRHGGGVMRLRHVDRPVLPDPSAILNARTTEQREFAIKRMSPLMPTSAQCKEYETLYTEFPDVVGLVMSS